MNPDQEKNAADRAEQQCVEMVVEGRPTGCVVIPLGKKTAAMAKVAIERKRPEVQSRHS